MENTGHQKKYFFVRIILPALLAFSLFTISIFVIIIPALEENMLERKREMIRELTNSAWSILDEFYLEEISNTLSEEEAKNEAIERIKNMRYGTEGKDYFWIIDKQPVMVMHPYREELNNTSLIDYADPEGKKLFVEFVKVVAASEQGYVEYMWQWKDDSTRIVPKLSYVKGFDPWGWIIGTGIYVEDVKEEISNLTSRLIYISLSILVLLASLLALIMHQSLKIEKKKQEAEFGLRESEAKYRALVEASTDGQVMVLNNSLVYSNKPLLSLYQVSELDFYPGNLHKLLCSDTDNSSGAEYFRSLLKGEMPSAKTDAQIKMSSETLVEVVFYASPITLADKSGYSIIVKDVSTHKKIVGQLGESKEKYNQLANNIKAGVFRASLDRKGKFLEINKAGANLLGYENRKDAMKNNILDFFHDPLDRKNFVNLLFSKDAVDNMVLPILKPDNTTTMLSISAVLMKDSDGQTLYCDGLLRDVTEKLKIDEERDNLIVELQASIQQLNEPVINFARNIISCNMNTSISKAASLMTKMNYDALLIKASDGNYIGIITDRDMRERVVGENLDFSNSVYDVMTSPLETIMENSLVFEALLFMHQKNTRHLAIKNSSGEIIGIVGSEEFLSVQSKSSTYLLKKIESAESEEDLFNIQKQLPAIVKSMVNSGAKSQYITKRITSVTDGLVNKFLDLAIDEIGQPPAKFSFLALGSQGREEQTLFTDQDNAIIFEDVQESDLEMVSDYFNKLSMKVCGWLNECGYTYCEGDSMAQNPKWCQPLSVWKKYFSHWVYNSDPQDLLELSIFFDFRPVYGEEKLAEDLRKHLFKTVEGQAGFFQHLVKNCLLQKPPVGILGNIQLESKGKHRETLNIKNATMPLSDFARIYAIKSHVAETNTLTRFNKLYDNGTINRNTHQELVQAYHFVMQLRIKHQSMSFENGLDADNAISPVELSQIELKTLKNTFTQIISIQKKLSYDFTGEAL